MPQELQSQLAIDLVAFLIGICFGSFLNVVALRSLQGMSWVWPGSHCPSCEHKLGITDNIPVVSWLFLKGRCRYCREKISWQYPVVELTTGITVVAILHCFVFADIPWPSADAPIGPDNVAPIARPMFDAIAYALSEKANATELNAQAAKSQGGQKLELQAQAAQAQSHIQSMPDDLKWPLAAGLLVFAFTLIAVTVTDFREKLIPHEITYPSMIIGIIFSAMVRHDLAGAMAGIGASYIIFDFLAFYGLKVYMAMHGHSEDLEDEDDDDDIDQSVDQSLKIEPDPSQDEPVEVMGGGDAVLSAVMSAYLGWQLLAVALGIGFIIGTVMGLALLVVEMRKSGLLPGCLKRSLLWATAATALFGGGSWFLYRLTLPDDPQIATAIAIPMAIAGATGGALLAVVSVGTRVSKPYPFGPALAAGGFVAMFLIPNWLIFH